MKPKQPKENKLTYAVLSQETLKSLMHYDPDTGVFTHIKARKGVRVGKVAGSVEARGYMRIRVEGKFYKAHRLAWLYVHGHFPPEQLDHINRDRSDNSIGNLRIATHAENGQNRSMQSNNTSGHVGVSWHKQRQKWMAHIKINQKRIHLGLFSDLSEALPARKAAELKYHTFQHN